MVSLKRREIQFGLIYSKLSSSSSVAKQQMIIYLHCLSLYEKSLLTEWLLIQTWVPLVRSLRGLNLEYLSIIFETNQTRSYKQLFIYYVQINIAITFIIICVTRFVLFKHILLTFSRTHTKTECVMKRIQVCDERFPNNWHSFSIRKYKNI